MSDIVDSLQISRSTCFAILETLERRTWVERRADRTYEPGRGLIPVANAVRARLPILQRADRVMRASSTTSTWRVSPCRSSAADASPRSPGWVPVRDSTSVRCSRSPCIRRSVPRSWPTAGPRTRSAGSPRCPTWSPGSTSAGCWRRCGPTVWRSGGSTRRRSCSRRRSSPRRPSSTVWPPPAVTRRRAGSASSASSTGSGCRSQDLRGLGPGVGGLPGGADLRSRRTHLLRARGPRAPRGVAPRRAGRDRGPGPGGGRRADPGVRRPARNLRTASGVGARAGRQPSRTGTTR